jgi:hypothetical protein
MPRDATVQCERVRAREALLNAANSEGPSAKWCREAGWPQKQEYQRRSEMSARRRKPGAAVRVVRYSEREGPIRSGGDGGETHGQRSPGETNRVSRSAARAGAERGLR